MSTLTRLLRSTAWFSATATWVAGTIVLALVVRGSLSAVNAVAVFTLIAVLIAVRGMRSDVAGVHTVLGHVNTELGGVHQLVNSQHDELLLRIVQLVDALNDAGVEIPASPGDATPAEHAARERNADG